MNITKLFVGLTSRRSMLRGGLVGPGLMGAALLAGMPATSLARDFRDGDELTEGDVSILRFLAALEILEADLWGEHPGQRAHERHRHQDLYGCSQQHRQRHVAVHSRQH